MATSIRTRRCVWHFRAVLAVFVWDHADYRTKATTARSPWLPNAVKSLARAIVVLRHRRSTLMAHVAPRPSPTHSHVSGSTNSSYICARCETASKYTTSLEPHMRECVDDGRPPTCSLEQTGGSHSCSIELASVTRQASTSAGAVRAERRVRSALTLEAGKSPTEVRWRRPLPTALHPPQPGRLHAL